MAKLFVQVADVIGKRWCYYLHPAPMWPVNGTYQCPRCQRRFPVPWEEKEPLRIASAAAAAAPVKLLEGRIEKMQAGAVQVG